ncbi:iron-sulfur cluster assembly protein 1 [Phtheirospermum japonicum]|uniref:Iron-sulfur cluster assembly protein 1 n=1 Tax=Phtheirospermum japonicum TaxID=374723 RepID=A0A830CA80_9LAMI|nr:iron-sulfur cluster assembly protein 1 [Phtheirospermum japonicum]
MLRHATSRILGQGMRSPAAPTLRMYHERVVDHYINPRNIRPFEKRDSNVGTGLVGAPACGDVMKLQIKVDEESGKTVDACFKTFRCGSAISSSSVGMCCEHEWGFNQGLSLSNHYDVCVCVIGYG